MNSSSNLFSERKILLTTNFWVVCMQQSRANRKSSPLFQHMLDLCKLVIVPQASLYPAQRQKGWFKKLNNLKDKVKAYTQGFTTNRTPNRMASAIEAGLNLCRNKPDPAPPISDPAPHFVRSPSSHANERCLCWPIVCTNEKSSKMTTLAAHLHLK